MRASATLLTRATWQREVLEPWVAIMGIELMASQERFRLDFWALGNVSLHALARRFQRGFDNSRATIFADLTTIARNSVSRNEVNQFRIPCSGGAWIGAAETVIVGSSPPKVILSVRTFITGNSGRGMHHSTPALTS